MIFADHVADDARGFAVRLVPFVAVLVHREEDAPMHGLQSVARVRECTRHDHAHGVIEIALFHLLGDRNRANIRGAAGYRRGISFISHAIKSWQEPSANLRSVFLADWASKCHLFRPYGCKVFLLIFNRLPHYRDRSAYPIQVPIWASGVDREIAISASFISAGMSAKS